MPGKATLNVALEFQRSSRSSGAGVGGGGGVQIPDQEQKDADLSFPVTNKSCSHSEFQGPVSASVPRGWGKEPEPDQMTDSLGFPGPPRVPDRIGNTACSRRRGSTMRSRGAASRTILYGLGTDGRHSGRLRVGSWIPVPGNNDGYRVAPPTPPPA